jgi:hypothetical protein
MGRFLRALAFCTGAGGGFEPEKRNKSNHQALERVVCPRILFVPVQRTGVDSDLALVQNGAPVLSDSSPLCALDDPDGTLEI